MTGLPWQAVSDGEQLMHEPLRLTVVIEAPRPAVAAGDREAPEVADLVENGWLTLLVREGDDFHRRTADGRLAPPITPAPQPARAPFRAALPTRSP